MKQRLLVLGGTAEAVELATEAIARFGARLEVVSALAGRTQAPRLPQGIVRVGGFGGAVGLADYLRAERIDYVIDVTHPFAVAISAHAIEASARTGVPCLALVRPDWQTRPGDRWHRVPDAEAAAAALGRAGARRVFLTIGQRGLEAFARLDGVFFLVRMIEPPSSPLPLGDHRLILARGPFAIDGEAALMREHRVDHLVTRASGGAATIAKLDAARSLGLPVILIERPAPPNGDSVESVEAALGWLAARLGA